MNGLSQSPSFTPVARSRLRCAARESPRLIVSERILWTSSGGIQTGSTMISDAPAPSKPSQGGSRASGRLPEEVANEQAGDKRHRNGHQHDQRPGENCCRLKGDFSHLAELPFPRENRRWLDRDRRQEGVLDRGPSRGCSFRRGWRDIGHRLDHLHGFRLERKDRLKNRLREWVRDGRRRSGGRDLQSIICKDVRPDELGLYANVFGPQRDQVVGNRRRNRLHERGKWIRSDSSGTTCSWSSNLCGNRGPLPVGGGAGRFRLEPGNSQLDLAARALDHTAGLPLRNAQ